MTSAPSARVAATLTPAADSGITRTARIPNARAAYATAWAWLPLDGAITPRRSSSVNAAILVYAPRILKAPIGCSDSGLSQTSPAHRAGNSGVRTATPATRFCAARSSSSVTRSAIPMTRA